MFSWRSHLTKEQYRHFRIHNFAFSICIWYFTVTPCWLATNTFFILLRVYIVRVTIFPCFFVLAFELHETEMGSVISIFHIHLEWNDFCSHEHFRNLPPSDENSVPNNFFWKTMLAKLLFSSWNISICLNSFYQKLAHTKKLMKNINSVAIVNDSSSLSFRHTSSQTHTYTYVGILLKNTRSTRWFLLWKDMLFEKDQRFQLQDLVKTKKLSWINWDLLRFSE